MTATPKPASVKRFWVHPSNTHEMEDRTDYPMGCVAVVDAARFDESERKRRSAEDRNEWYQLYKVSEAERLAAESARREAEGRAEHFEAQFKFWENAHLECSQERVAFKSKRDSLQRTLDAVRARLGQMDKSYEASGEWVRKQIRSALSTPPAMSDEK